MKDLGPGKMSGLGNRLIGVLGIAAVALNIMPDMALAQEAEESQGMFSSNVSVTKTFDETLDVSIQNEVKVEITKDIEVAKDVDFVGAIVTGGNIEVSESALATIDNRQIINDGMSSFSGTDMEIINAVTVGTDVLQSADGNIGINLASGNNILQQNMATIASLGSISGAGASDAAALSLQNGANNTFGGPDAEATVVNRLELLGNVLEGAAGNVGLNVSLGAFNIQNNSLALTSAAGSVGLAQATAFVTQQTSFAKTIHTNVTNQITLGNFVLANATGNIGINLSAGTNIYQQNTLVISTGQ